MPARCGMDLSALSRVGGLLLAAALLVAVSGGGIAAQTLGDVARKEGERRKAVPVPGKVYTNEALPVVPSLPSIPAGRAEQPASGPETAEGDPPKPDGGTAEGEAPASETASAPAATDDAEGERDESYWRTRIAQERDALRRSHLFADALQTRINALTADFTARDDPAQRDLIAADRQRAVAELERLREEIAAQGKAVAATEEEARRTGVPSGWLR